MLTPGESGLMRLPYEHLFLAALAVAATACGGEDAPTVMVSSSKTTLASGDSTTLTVTVTNFELRDPSAHALTVADTGHEHEATGETVTSDGGHYHVYLDSTDENPLKMAWTPTVDVTVTASVGVHQLIVRLNADDHRFLVPEVEDHVDITVE